MALRRQLSAKEVISLIIQRTRKRVTALDGVRLTEYEIALYELRLLLNLLERGYRYIEANETRR